MFCEDCYRFEKCEIIHEMRKLQIKIREFREKVQTKLFHSDPKMHEKYKEEKERLRIQRLKLRKKQLKCFDNRMFKHYKLGYTCFKPEVSKKVKEVNRTTKKHNLNSFL